MDSEAQLSEIKEYFKNVFEKKGNQSSSSECIDRYTQIYLLSIPEDNATKLYACYEEILSSYLTNNVMPILTQHHGFSLLTNLAYQWDFYKNHITKPIHSAFSYIDRSFTTRNSLPALIDVETLCFKRDVFVSIQREVTETILEIIEKRRKTEALLDTSDKALLRRVVVDMFMEMGCYKDGFEAAMLESTSAFYSREAEGWIERMSRADYLINAANVMKKETNLSLDFLHSSSVDKVVEEVRDELLRVPAKRLFEDEKLGFLAMIRGNEVHSVRLILRVYRGLSEELEQVAELFGEHVREEVKDLLELAEKESSGAIEKLIEVHDKYYRKYLNDVFKWHEFFEEALTKAFEDEFEMKSFVVELIVNYCDEILKRGEDGDVDRILKSIALVLEYVKDKDVFTELYCKKLAQRLLFGQSGNIANENTMLAYMKRRLDDEFSVRIEEMINDVTKTEANNEKFEKFVSQSPLLIGYVPVDLSVNVIAFDKWPKYELSNIKMPDEFERSAESYTMFFKDQNKNKKLTWLHTLGTCVIEAQFKAKSIELTVSTYQAIVLSLFNSEDSLSYFDIKTRLEVNDDEHFKEELLQTLHSLSCSKYKILLKKPESNNVSKDDVFEFNAKFNDPNPQIKVPFPSAELEKERKKAQSAIDSDRRYVVDCAIVQIMKHHKVLAHQSLMTECVELLSPKFELCLNLFKKRVDCLIDRDFIERDEKDSTILHYVP